LVRDPEQNRCIEFVTLADHPTEGSDELTQVKLDARR
jgi:hypothetical protein